MAEADGETSRDFVEADGVPVQVNNFYIESVSVNTNIDKGWMMCTGLFVRGGDVRRTLDLDGLRLLLGRLGL